MKSRNESGWHMAVRPVAMLLIGIAAAAAASSWAGDNVWTSIGPEGGAISALAIDPQNLNTIYAVPYSGSGLVSVMAGVSQGRGLLRML